MSTITRGAKKAPARPATRTRKGARPANQWWEQDAVEAPRADVSIADRNAKKIRFTRIVVMSSVYLLPVSLLMGIVYAADVLTEEPPAEAQQVSLDTPTKSAAIMAVEDWLATDPSPLPSGRVLSWDASMLASIDPWSGQAAKFEVQVYNALPTASRTAPHASVRH